MSNPAAHRPDPPLVAILREMTIRAERAPELLEPLRIALDAGADPNAIGKDGRAALDMLAHVSAQSNWRALREAALLLMAHGANAQREHPQSKNKTTILTHMARGVVVNNGNLSNIWTHLASTLVEGIVNQERRGLFMHDHGGNNPLHAVCEHGLELVPYLFQERLFRPEWIAQSNNDGETPLHCLWKKRNDITDLIEFNGMDRTIEALWQATADLVAHGADLSLASAKGKVPQVLIKDMVQQGLPLRGQAPLVQSWIQAAEIGAVVPIIATQASGPRF